MNLDTLCTEKARRIKNENQNKNIKLKKVPLSSNLPEKITKIKVGETTVFITFNKDGESLETLLFRHFKGVNDSEN